MSSCDPSGICLSRHSARASRKLHREIGDPPTRRRGERRYRACVPFGTIFFTRDKKEGTPARRALRYDLLLGDQTATTLCLALPWTGSAFESVSRTALITA